MSERELPPGWAIKHYTAEAGATIKGPTGTWDIQGDREDAHELFWAIWDAATTCVHAQNSHMEKR